MTLDEYNTEFRYRYHERIGHLAGSGTPTPEHEQIARKEAAAAMDELERIETEKHQQKGTQ